MNPSRSSPADFLETLRRLMAQGSFREALEEFRRVRDQQMPPTARLLAATAATRLGELGLAIGLAESALENFRARGDDDGRMRVLNLLGVIEFERGNLDRAFQCFTDTLGLAHVLNDTLMIARASNNLASLADLRGDASEALALYRAALLSYQRLGDRRGTAEAYHNLGIVFRQMEEWSEAESAASQAVRHAETLNERAILGLAVMGRAEISLHRGALDLARRELSWAETLAAEARDELGSIEIGLLRAQLMLAEDRPEMAANEAEAARAAAEQSNAALLQAQCAATAARALKTLGRVTLAETRRAEATRLFQAQGAKRRLTELEETWKSP